MGNLIIKGKGGPGNKLILQDQSGAAVLTTGDAGVDIPAVTGNLTVSGDLVTSTPLGHRNMIINGGMQLWQRGTAATAATDYDTVDRWKMNENSDGAFTSQKHNMSLAELNTTGHRTALQLDVTTADTSIAASQYCYFRQHVEGQNAQMLQYGTANAKTMTLSFWVKSNKTGTYCVSIQKDVATALYNPINYTISSADTWEQKKITITPTDGSTSLVTGSGGVVPNTNGTGISLNFGLAWGSNYHGTNQTWTSTSTWSTSSQVNWMDSTSNNFYLTGVQLELGSNATPFEHRSYGDEELRCMRYCIASFVDGVTPGGTAPASARHHYVAVNPYSGGSFAGIITELPVKMRAVPAVTFWTGSAATDATSGRVSYWDGNWSHNNGLSFDASQATQENFNLGGNINSSTRLIQFNYLAEAEL